MFLEKRLQPEGAPPRPGAEKLGAERMDRQPGAEGTGRNPWIGNPARRGRGGWSGNPGAEGAAAKREGRETGGVQGEPEGSLRVIPFSARTKGPETGATYHSRR